MSAEFDPYHRWLGIPPKHQPPDYYRLLALERYEDDEEVIRDAAERQTTHVREYQLGEYAELAHKLLNELGRAKACLLDDQKRQEYDLKLRADAQATNTQPADPSTSKATQQSTQSPLPFPGEAEPPLRRTQSEVPVIHGAVEQAASAPVTQTMAVEENPRIHIATPAIGLATDSGRQRKRKQHRDRRKPAVIGGSIAGGLMLIILLIMLLTSGNEDNTREEKPAPDANKDSGSPPLSDSTRFKVTEEQPKQPPTLLVNSIGMKLRLIPAGEFLMGSGESAGSKQEHPQHRVRISREFYLGTTEVTQGQWRAVMGTSPWSGKSYVKEGADYPATNVSWNDAVEFCRKLIAKEGVTYRLPTEAEWEYACRAGTATMYSFGDDVSQLGTYAWYSKNAYDVDEQYAHTVGTKRPNAWGLYDMHGNVSEWCSDWYDNDYYSGSPQTDPSGAASGTNRVYRGGSWNYGTRDCRSAYRYRYTPGYRIFYRGIRVACSFVTK